MGEETLYRAYGRRAPRISELGGVVEDRWRLERALSATEGQVTGFAAAVALLNYSRDNGDLGVTYPIEQKLSVSSLWSMMAARDGAIRVRDFEDAMNGANGYLKKCAGESLQLPIISPYKMLDEAFPQRAKIRHAAAHTTARNKNDEQAERHSANGPYEAPGISIGPGATNTTIQDMLINSTYTSTWSGEFVSYDLSLKSFQVLENIKCAFFDMIPEQMLYKDPWPSPPNLSP